MARGFLRKGESTKTTGFGIFTKGEIYQNLNSRLRRARNDMNGSYAVTYTAHYAYIVHESSHVAFRNGQAKFLEQPARQRKNELREIVRTHTLRTGSVRVGMYMAAKRLLKWSQKLVPVKTGFLKRSGKVIKEK